MIWNHINVNNCIPQWHFTKYIDFAGFQSRVYNNQRGATIAPRAPPKKYSCHDLVVTINFRNKTVETIIVDRINVSPREQSKKKPYLNAP
jgi:hypothetical protein